MDKLYYLLIHLISITSFTRMYFNHIKYILIDLKLFKIDLLLKFFFNILLYVYIPFCDMKLGGFL